MTKIVGFHIYREPPVARAEAKAFEVTISPLLQQRGLSRRPLDGRHPKIMQVRLGRLLHVIFSKEKLLATPSLKSTPPSLNLRANLVQHESGPPPDLTLEKTIKTDQGAEPSRAMALEAPIDSMSIFRSGAPTAAISPIAKVGFEIEVPSVRVLPSRPRGTVLLHGSGWRLETDQLPTMEADLEFVLSPMSRPADIKKAMSEIIGFIERLRTAALDNPGQQVRLSAIADSSLHCVLKVNDCHMPARLQATYGVSLDRVAKSIDKLLLPGQARRIHQATEKVAAYYKKTFDMPLTKAAEGFVELLNMYLQRAVGGSDSGTVHIYFRMLARSDFCSMYDKLLDPVSQKQVKRLLIPATHTSASIFMMALALDADATVFREPYKDYNLVEDFKGPSITEWFASIINGRGEGPLKKDLMSPPPGYPLHSGNFESDYGMGAMSVDEENKLALFEIRGALHRPDTIPMNGQILNAVLREYIDAQDSNPSLAKLSQPFLELAPDYEIIARYEEVRNELTCIYEKLLRVFEGNLSWKATGFRIDLCQTKLRQLIGASPGHQFSRLHPAHEGLVKFARMLENFQNSALQQTSAEDMAHELHLFAQELRVFAQTLWDAGT